MLENIFAGIIATIICSLTMKIWQKFKNRKKQDTQNENSKITLKDIKLIRKQFFICLIYLFVIVVGLIFKWFKNDILLTFISTTLFFAFIFLWGAFDAIFNPIKKELENSKDEFTNKNTEGN